MRCLIATLSAAQRVPIGWLRKRREGEEGEGEIGAKGDEKKDVREEDAGSGFVPFEIQLFSHPFSFSFSSLGSQQRFTVFLK